jgi:hypothetical protein
VDSGSGVHASGILHFLVTAGKISFDDIYFGIALSLSQLLAGSGIQLQMRHNIVANIKSGLQFAGEPDFDEALSLLRRLADKPGALPMMSHSYGRLSDIEKRRQNRAGAPRPVTGGRMARVLTKNSTKCGSGGRGSCRATKNGIVVGLSGDRPSV